MTNQKINVYQEYFAPNPAMTIFDLCVQIKRSVDEVTAVIQGSNLSIDQKIETISNLPYNVKAYKKMYNMSNKKQLTLSQKEAIKLYKKDYFAKNKEKVDSYTKQWHASNKETVAAKRKQYTIENREKINLRRQKHRAENREEINSYQREWQGKKRLEKRLSKQ